MPKTLEEQIEKLEWTIHLLEENIESMRKQYEFDIRRPRQLRGVLELLEDGNYKVCSVIKVLKTPDGEEIIISYRGDRQ